MPIHFKSFFFSIFFYVRTLASQTAPPENPGFFPTSSRQLAPQQPALQQPGPHSKHTNSSKSWNCYPIQRSYKELDMDKWKIFPKVITKIEPHDIILGQNKTTSQYDRGNAWYHILNHLQHRRLRRRQYCEWEKDSLPADCSPTKHPSPTLSADHFRLKRPFPPFSQCKVPACREK